MVDMERSTADARSRMISILYTLLLDIMVEMRSASCALVQWLLSDAF